MNARLLLLALLGAVVACGGARTTPVTGAAPSDTAMLRAVIAAKSVIDSAARAGDIERMLAVVDDSTQLVPPGGETLVGRASVREWLAGFARATTRVDRVQMSPARYEYCTDGVVEREGTWLVPFAGPAGPDTLEGHYSVRWDVDAGRARVRRISFVSAKAHPARVTDCPSRSWAAVQRNRFTVFLALPPALADQPKTSDDFTKQSAKLGYGSGRLMGLYGPLTTYEGTADPVPRGFGLVGIRYRVRGPFAIEAARSLRGTRTMMQAYNPSTSSHVSLLDESHFSEVLVSAEWRRLRPALGTIVVSDGWKEREVPITGSGTSWTVTGPAWYDAWKTTKVGVVAQGSYAIPVVWRFTADVLAQYRFLGSTEVHATPRRAAMPIDLNGFTGGVRAGVSF